MFILEVVWSSVLFEWHYGWLRHLVNPLIMTTSPTLVGSKSSSICFSLLAVSSSRRRSLAFICWLSVLWSTRLWANWVTDMFLLHNQDLSKKIDSSYDKNMTGSSTLQAIRIFLWWHKQITLIIHLTIVTKAGLNSLLIVWIPPTFSEDNCYCLNQDMLKKKN